MSEVPTFETERLLLRAVALADAPAYQKHFVDYEVISQLASAVPWPYPENGAYEYLETIVLPNQGKDRWLWGLFLKTSPNELIGAVDLWREGRPENRGFWLGRKFWGQGLMTEAVKPVMDYAFDHLGFEKLIFSNALGNTKSRRVKEKTGAVLIGTRRAAFVNPNYTEAETWELTKSAWTKFSAASDFLVRLATLEDAKDIGAIHAASWKTTYKGIVHQSFLDSINAETRVAGAIKKINRSDLDCLVLIDSNGKTIGFADVGPCREKKIDADGELYAIYLLKEAQGQGGGRALFEAAVRAAKDRGFQKMTVSVLEDNSSSRRFYEKMGATLIGSDRVDIEERRYPTSTYIWELIR
jgi:ribosomal-protein-alanine N-acetyltransferase